MAIASATSYATCVLDENQRQDCWLQLHNNNLLVSKITTVLKQERPNASTDTSNIPLVVYFISDVDNRRAGLWMIKLTDSCTTVV